MFLTNDASFAGRLYVAGDVSLNGNVRAVTPAISDNSTKIATTAYVTSLINSDLTNYYTKLQTNSEISATLNNYASTYTLTNNYYTANQVDASINESYYNKSTIDVSINNNLANYIKAQDPAFSGTSTFNGPLVNNNDVSMNGNLFVGLDSYFNGNLITNLDNSLNGNLFVGSDASFNGNAYVGKDLYVNGNLVVSQYSTRQTVTTINYQLMVAQDISLSGRLFVIGDSSLNGNLYVSKNTSQLGDATLRARLFVSGDASMTSRVFVGSDVSINGNISIGNNISLPGISLGSSNSRFNSVYGISSGTALTTGFNNTFIGYQTGNVLATGSNTTAIGYGANPTASTTSNEITLGNSSISKLRCAVTNITALSDVRDKTNIEPIPAGLDFISKLNPVKFTWNMRDGGKVGVDEFGFIAQELDSVQTTTGINYPNLVSLENPDRLEASYTTLVPALVKAIQELQIIVNEQREEINSLKEKIV